MIERQHGSVKKSKPSIFKNNIQKTGFIGIIVVPSFLFYLIMGLYPNILSFYYSLFQWNGIGKKVFVGLFNYKEMIKDSLMWEALYHNFLLLLLVTIPVIFISLVLAYLLVDFDFKENKVYKVIYYFPNVLSVVIICLFWTFVYDGNNGLLNALLEIIGVDMHGFYWLGDERTALLSVAVTTIWGGVGFNTVIFMNAISTIPRSIYEAAYIEGITHIQKFYKITVPLILNVVKVAAIFVILGMFKGFESILILTGGGPSGSTNVIGNYMFTYAFGELASYGYASSVGNLLFVILVSLKLFVDKVLGKESLEY